MSRREITEMIDQLIGVCWLMTTKCNLRCPMCYRYRVEEEALGFAAKRKVADKLSQLGIRKVTFAGGEPLLEPDILKIIKHVSSLGMKTALCTNGYLLSPEMLGKLDGYLHELTIPVDGSNPEIQSCSRGTQDSFENSMRLLRITRAHSIDVDVSTVLSKCNIHDIFGILRLVLQSGVRKWKIFQFYPLGDGLRNRDRFEISPEESDSIAKELAPYRSLVEIDHRSSDQNTMLSYFHISPNGTMLLVNKNRYEGIGNFLSCDDISTALAERRFDFQIHSNRHRRDV